ncbi:MAG: hypothetical protein NTZ39_11640 [Methanoregula sp.]|nr:hypothetical protein [Methanoregula sp.]
MKIPDGRKYLFTIESSSPLETKAMIGNQIPENVDPRVPTEINTFVVMALGDHGDRHILIGSARQDQ